MRGRYCSPGARPERNRRTVQSSRPPLIHFSCGIYQALVVLQYLAQQPPGYRASAAAIRTAVGFPSSLRRVLEQLARAAVIHVIRGREGGYSFTADLRQISLLQILEAMQVTKSAGRARISSHPSDKMMEKVMDGLVHCARERLGAIHLDHLLKPVDGPPHLPGIAC